MANSQNFPVLFPKVITLSIIMDQYHSSALNSAQ